MKVISRRFAILVLACASASVFSGCAKKPPVTEAVVFPPFAVKCATPNVAVARVNGVELCSDVLEEIMTRMSLNTHNTTSTGPGEMKKRALDQMIIQELAVQEAARLGETIEASVMSSAMNKVITNLGHEAGYEAYLKSRHMTDQEMRSQVERQLLIQRIYAREVKSKVSAAQDDIKKEYELHKDAYQVPDKVSVVDIAFSQQQGAEKMLIKVKETIAALNADKDKNPHNLPSDDAYTVRDLDIENGKEPYLYDAALHLREKEISGLIETPVGAHIIQLVKYTPKKQMTFDEAKGIIEKRIKGGAEIKRFLDWEKELRKDAKIEVVEAEKAQTPESPDHGKP